MREDKFYLEAKDIFDKVIYAYKKLLENYSFKELALCSHEMVFIVEDTFIVYIGLIEKYPQKTLEEKQFTYEFHNNSIEMLYFIHLEELMPNDIFKFVSSKFTKQFHIDDYQFFNIKKFNGINNPYGKFGIGSVFKYVDKKLPNLNLLKRFNDWNGYLYHFIIYEIIDYENNRAFCIFKTNKNNPNKVATAKIKELQNLLLIWKGNFNYHSSKDKILYHYQGIDFNDELRKVAHNLIHSPKFKQNNFEMYGQINYCIANGYIKNEADLENKTSELFMQAMHGKFDEIEKFNYLKTPTKWKSEYLIKEICEKLYGKNNVIYQHRPYFLHTKKGQLSYDIYLIKKKIAIEYQGKQHFVPIEYFGGESSFAKQKERDVLKKKLSEQNNIKLIYINYNDPITSEFISEKIKEALEI